MDYEFYILKLCFKRLDYGLKWCLNFYCQVPLPDEPDTDDEAKIKKWKWKVKSVQKENRERYSLRCDIELKLAVSFF